MKKNNLMSYLALLIVFALFNVIVFLIPTEKTPTFWTAYAFTVVAFAAQIVVRKIAFNKKCILLGIPMLYFGIVYLAVQLIAFAIFMLFPVLHVKAAVIVCSVILAIFMIFVITAQAGADEITQVEDKIKVKRAFIQFLQVDIEMLAESENNAEIKAELKKLAEKVRYSDPMSHEMLGDLEARISAKVEEMKTSENKKTLIGEIDTLLTERNKKCKILK